MKWLRRIAWVMAALGLVSIGLGVSWDKVALPRLKVFPTNLDTTLHYTGTFTLYLDAKTALPLAQARTVPLEITRHVTSYPEYARSDVANIHESIDLSAGDVLSSHQENLYTINRRTLLNVPDIHTYAFSSDNHVSRSGYRMNFPFGASPLRAYPLYTNEIGTTKPMGATANPWFEKEGVQLLMFTSNLDRQPATDGYVKWLAPAGVPESLTLDQLDPRLRSVGIDFPAVTAALTPKLDIIDAGILGKLQTQPITLHYLFSATGETALEPRTGSIADVTGIHEKLEAQPDMSAIGTMQQILAKYQNVPGVPQALVGLQKLAAMPPDPVFEYRYEQTPASVHETLGLLKDQFKMLDLAEQTLPTGLKAAGLGLLVVGLVILLATRRRRPEPAEVPSEIDLTAPVPPHPVVADVPGPGRLQHPQPGAYRKTG